jgi:hypothetical protein
VTWVTVHQLKSTFKPEWEDLQVSGSEGVGGKRLSVLSLRGVVLFSDFMGINVT